MTGAHSFLGMDTDQAREVAEGMRRRRAQIAGHWPRLHARIAACSWEGKDSEQWRELFYTRLVRAATQLETVAARYAAVLEGQCEQQESASRPSALCAAVTHTPSRRYELAADSRGPRPADLRHRFDWLTGERIPTLMEFLAGGIVDTATDIQGVPWLDTGQRPWFETTPSVQVTGVYDVDPRNAPLSLADLVFANDEARRDMLPTGHPGHGFSSSQATQVRIQQLRAADGTLRVIVHAPPTSGAPLVSIDAWGGQGNPTDWASNVVASAGETSGGMVALQEAMRAQDAAGRPLIPAGTPVMIVGHSQGGLSTMRLLEDPTFADPARGGFDVTHTLTVGAPVEAFAPSGDTQVLNISAVAPVPWRGEGQPGGQVGGQPGGQVGGQPGGQAAHDGAPAEGYAWHESGWPLPTDPVAGLDLNGWRLNGSQVSHPHVTDIQLPTPPARGANVTSWEEYLGLAHDSVIRDEDGRVLRDAGYYGALTTHQETHPDLRAFAGELEGLYLGEGVRVERDVVVQVSREPR